MSGRSHNPHAQEGERGEEGLDLITLLMYSFYCWGFVLFVSFVLCFSFSGPGVLSFAYSGWWLAYLALCSFDLCCVYKCFLVGAVELEEKRMIFGITGIWSEVQTCGAFRGSEKANIT